MKNDKEFYIVEPIGATIVHFTIDYNDLKFIVIGIGIEIAFGELKVKVGDKFENLLNGISQILYSLYRAKGITKNVCNNIMNSIK